MKKKINKIFQLDEIIDKNLCFTYMGKIANLSVPPKIITVRIFRGSEMFEISLPPSKKKK